MNTYLDPAGSPTIVPQEVIRSTNEEKEYAINSCDAFRARNDATAAGALETLKQAAVQGDNVFESLMQATKVCSLGQLSAALYEVGGEYRRMM